MAKVLSKEIYEKATKRKLNAEKQNVGKPKHRIIESKEKIEPLVDYNKIPEPVKSTVTIKIGIGYGEERFPESEKVPSKPRLLTRPEKKKTDTKSLIEKRLGLKNNDK